MKQILLPTFLLIFFLPYFSFAQNAKFKMDGETTKKTVKLLWMPVTWINGFEGVNVKRRAIVNGSPQEWKKLNSSLIFPESTLKKDLSNIEKDPQQLARLIDKRKKLMSALGLNGNKVFSIKREDYLKGMQNKKHLESIKLLISLDYDIAIINGFAMVDRNIPKADAYEYGLFPHYTDSTATVPAALFKWKYGDETVVKIDMKVKIKSNRKKTIAKIYWDVNRKQYIENTTISGFNVYRKEKGGEYIQINKKRIVISSEDGKKPKIFYKDKNIEQGVNYIYAAAPITMFNLVGEKSEIEFNSSKVAEEIKAPLLVDNAPDNYYPRDGVELTWTFEKTQENLIQGFKIQRKFHGESKYEDITDILPVTDRSFNDKFLPPSSTGFYYYRLFVVVEDDFLFSNPVKLFCNPAKLLLVPSNFKAKYVKRGQKLLVRLTWDKKEADDTVTAAYTIFCDRTTGYLSRESSIPLITENQYYFEIGGEDDVTYKFSVAAIGKNNQMTESSVTDTAYVPTRKLPFLDFSKIDKTNNKVTLNWEYPNDISDLKGFRVFFNGRMVADERTLKSNIRTWQTTTLTKGKHTFQIMAITKYGIYSEKSPLRFAIIKN